MSDSTCLEICFLPLSRRTLPASCFYRVIGRDRAGRIEAFVQKYSQLAQGSGLCLRGGIANPTEPEIQRFFAAVGEKFILSLPVIARHMTVWLGQLRPEQRQSLAAVISDCLARLQNQGANPDMLRNAYLKLMCWLRGPSGRVLRGAGRDTPPKVLFEGRINKYELLFLHLLHTAGCDVIYVDFCSEDSYRRADPEGGFSQAVFGELRTPSPASGADAGEEPQPIWSSLRQEVLLNGWAGDRPPWEAVLLSCDSRQEGGEPRLRALFSACFGADERSEYRNRLFHLKQQLEGRPAKQILIDHKIAAPTVDEAAPFRTVDKNQPRPALIRDLCARLAPACGRVQCLLAQCALEQILSLCPERDPVRFYNYGVRLACWLRRYMELLFDACQTAYQPAAVFYGPITSGEISLLWGLAHTGCDVLYFCPDRTAKAVFDGHFLPKDWRELDFPDTLPVEPFPQREERLQAATAAYHASRELDTLLYRDTGIFRDRQFARSQPITLKTTYDEIAQLWKEEAQYRPSFGTRDGVVYVPNLFAKISGVDRGDKALYWDNIRAMVTEQTYLVTSLPFWKREGTRETRSQAGALFHGSRLDPDAVKRSPLYRYAHLPDDTQDYILEKIQALIDYDMIADGGACLPHSILSTLMNLDKELLRLLQNFDFTRTIPKLLIVDVQETLFSLEECILLAFLNQVGFDIAVFSPTGYRDLEAHLRPDSFETHIVGPFLFDLSVPDLRRRPPGDWFNRLFGAGRC